MASNWTRSWSLNDKKKSYIYQGKEVTSKEEYNSSEAHQELCDIVRLANLTDRDSIYPESKVFDEIVFKSAKTQQIYVETSTGRERSEVANTTRLYYLTDQSGFHIPECTLYDCNGFPSLEMAINSNRRGCCGLKNDNLQWYEKESKPMTEQDINFNNPLESLFDKVEKNARSTHTKYNNTHVIGCEIEYNTLLIRPDLKNEKIPLMTIDHSTRYHLTSCTDQLCPGSQRYQTSLSKGIKEYSRCRPDLNFHFDTDDEGTVPLDYWLRRNGGQPPKSRISSRGLATIVTADFENELSAT
ncbi:uncharacterized protein L201_000072 [Kwoniella dendrophila CBS 6074]|uniref:Uncharacterized protein n=1 Tax=Kwoniella dendrophila CBS 6074 TaxID=1295534 RepID=A0AAX4JL97_9TREE